MITIEQNTERQLQRLAAQRQLYATAKTVFGWQVFLSGPVAVASAFLVLAAPWFKGIAASWGILVTLADLFWLTPWQKKFQDSAARIQEAFDCDVLELPWNEVKAGKPPDPELIKEQSNKYSKWARKMPPLQIGMRPQSTICLYTLAGLHVKGPIAGGIQNSEDAMLIASLRLSLWCFWL